MYVKATPESSLENMDRLSLHQKAHGWYHVHYDLQAATSGHQSDTFPHELVATNLTPYLKVTITAGGILIYPCMLP